MRSIAGLEPLVAAAATGDADAFARVIGATGGLVTSIALAIVRDVDMSQDIAQDVLCCTVAVSIASAPTAACGCSPDCDP